MNRLRLKKLGATIALGAVLLIPTGWRDTLQSVQLHQPQSVTNVNCEPDGGGMRCTIVMPDGTAKDIYIADP